MKVSRILLLISAMTVCSSLQAGFLDKIVKTLGVSDTEREKWRGTGRKWQEAGALWKGLVTTVAGDIVRAQREVGDPPRGHEDPLHFRHLKERRAESYQSHCRSSSVFSVGTATGDIPSRPRLTSNFLSAAAKEYLTDHYNSPAHMASLFRSTSPSIVPFIPADTRFIEGIIRQTTNTHVLFLWWHRIMLDWKISTDRHSYYAEQLIERSGKTYPIEYARILKGECNPCIDRMQCYDLLTEICRNEHFQSHIAEPRQRPFSLHIYRSMLACDIESEVIVQILALLKRHRILPPPQELDLLFGEMGRDVASRQQAENLAAVRSTIAAWWPDIMRAYGEQAHRYYYSLALSSFKRPRSRAAARTWYDELPTMEQLLGDVSFRGLFFARNPEAQKQLVEDPALLDLFLRQQPGKLSDVTSGLGRRLVPSLLALRPEQRVMQELLKRAVSDEDTTTMNDYCDAPSCDLHAMQGGVNIVLDALSRAPRGAGEFVSEAITTLKGKRYMPTPHEMMALCNSAGIHRTRLVDAFLPDFVEHSDDAARALLWEGAMARKDLPFLEALLSSPHFNPDTVMPDGKTPLLCLAEERQQAFAVNVAKKLLAHGANRNARDAEGYSILHHARRKGWADFERTVQMGEDTPLGRLKGQEEPIAMLREIIQRFKDGRPVRSNLVLLEGEPGTGKTTIARELSRELLGREPFEIEHSGGNDMFINGESTRLGETFRKIVLSLEVGDPSILLLDEFDTIAPNVTGLMGNSQMHAQKVITEVRDALDILLTKNVLVIATTNFSHLIERSVRTRFKMTIHFGPATMTSRRDIVDMHLFDWGRARVSDKVRDDLVEATQGWVPREIDGVMGKALEEAQRGVVDDAHAIVCDRHIHKAFELERARLAGEGKNLPEGIAYRPRRLQEARPAAGTGFDALKAYSPEVVRRMQYIKTYLDYPDRFAKYKVAGRLLLYGPPGTGKTAIARALSAEVRSAFFTLDGGQLKTQPKASEIIKNCFQKASELGRAIIFIDEMDAIANADSHCRETLQTCMEGFSKNPDVIVIGATNNPWDFDLPMLDRLVPIYVGLPGPEERAELFRFFLRQLPTGEPGLVDDVFITELVAMTEGIAPRSIERLTELASSQAGMRFAESGMTGDIPVTCDDVCRYLGKAMSKQYAQNVRYEEKMSVLPPSIAAAFEGL